MSGTSSAVVAPLSVEDAEVTKANTNEPPPASTKKATRPKLTDEEKKARQECFSLCFYIAFLLTFVVGTYLARGDENGYYMVEKVKDEVLYNEFLTSAGTPNHFYGVTHWDDMWRFINGPASPIRGFLLSERSAASNKYMREYLAYNQSWPNGGNVLLGGLRIRQVRIKENECMDEVDETLLPVIHQCNDKFYHSFEDKETFVGSVSGEEYVHQTEEELGESTWWGKLASYPGSGYALDIYPSESNYIEKMDMLKADDWIEPGRSRAVFLDFQLYNPAANLHFAGRCAFELPHTGGVRPKADFFGVKLHGTKGSSGKLQVAAEIALWIFCLIFLCVEIKEWYSLGYRRYWTDSWNYIDWGNIIILMGNLSLSLMIHTGQMGMKWYEPINAGLSDDREFMSMVEIMVFVFISNILSSVNALLLWIKLFRFLSFSPRMKVIFDTLGNAAVDLTYFGVLFAVFTIGFAHAGYLAFAGDVYDFRSISQSAKTLLLSIFSDMDNDAMNRSSRIFGPLYVIGYQMAMLMILVNVFLAIINDSYALSAQRAVDAEKLLKKDERKSIILKNAFSKSFGIMPNSKVSEAVSEIVAESISRDDLVAKLIENGMGESDANKKADDAFKFYDLNLNDKLDSSEVDKILEDSGMQSPRQKAALDDVSHDVSINDESWDYLLSALKNVDDELAALEGEVKDNRTQLLNFGKK